MKLNILLFGCLLPSIVFGQFHAGLILKIKPANFVFGNNPSLEIEKVVLGPFSLSLDLNWKRTYFLSSGGEYDFGSFTPSTGYKVGLNPRYYILNNDRTPFGWFFSGIIRYNDIAVDNFTKQSFNGSSEKVINIRSRGLETALLFGRQFKIWGLTSDISTGIIFYNENYQETLAFKGPNYSDHLGDCRRESPMMHIGFTIGYDFTPDKKNTLRWSK
jgi:hypothetical protein